MTLLIDMMFAMLATEDRNFMEELYRDHFRLMFATAWKFISEKAAVDDIVSESCLALMRIMETIRQLNVDQLKGYIVSTVRNTALNYLAKQCRARKHMASGIDIPEDQLTAPLSVDSIEEKIVLEDELAHVLEALNSLPEKEQQVMRMKFDEQLSDAEIAQAVGLSKSSIPQYIRRAREHLKAIIYA